MTLLSASRAPKRQQFCQRFDAFGNRCNKPCPQGETECDEHFRAVAPAPQPQVALHGFRSKVYFVYAPSLEVVKIGTAQDIEKRLAGIRGMCPVPLTLLGSIFGGVQVERWLHFHCYRDRSHYEWFRWTSRVQDIVRRVLAHGDSAALVMCPGHLAADRGRRRAGLLPLPMERGGRATGERFYLKTMKDAAAPLACACALCQEGK